MANLHLATLVLDGADPAMCQYLFKGNKAAPHVVITFNTAPLTTAAFEAGLRQGQQNVKPVRGVADAAFTFGSDGATGLSFLSGTTICSMLSLVPTTVAGETALAREILHG